MQLPDPVPEDKDHLKFIAQNLTGQMALVGNPRYYKQILVTSNLRTADINYYTICPTEWCISVQNYSSLNILVTRFIGDEQDRIYAAKQWLDPLVPKIHAIIEQNYNIDKMSQLKKKLVNGLDTELTDDAYYRTLAIVRSYTSPCRVKYGQTRYTTEHMAGTDFAMYHWDGSILRDCEDYILFFIL